MPTIVDAKWIEGYRIQLQFADGATGVVDLSRLVGKRVFGLWQELEAFRRFSIGNGRELRWSDEVDEFLSNRKFFVAVFLSWLALGFSLLHQALVERVVVQIPAEKVLRVVATGFEPVRSIAKFQVANQVVRRTHRLQPPPSPDALGVGRNLRHGKPASLSKPGAWYPSAKPSLELHLTELPDPAIRAIYFHVPNPLAADLSDEELLGQPGRHQNN